MKQLRNRKRKLNLHKYFNNCVNWDPSDVDKGLIIMIEDAVDITRNTFKKKIDTEELRTIEKQLGYFKNKRSGLTMGHDWHVSYHKSFLRGERVYFFTHSAIEYVFKQA